MAMMRNEDIDSLYDIINSDDSPIEFDHFKQTVNDLVDAGFIVRNINVSQDQVWYKGKIGLKYSDFSGIDNALKQHILTQFIENPATFFVLFNTQKGKSAIVQKRLISWAREPKKQIVSILMLDNDQTLGEQTIEGLVARLKKEGVNVKLFTLVSTSKNTVEEILTYIDAYASNSGEEEYPMPLITALTNFKQSEKILRILRKVLVRNEKRYPNLYYGMIWDEADKTYPLVRDKVAQIEGNPMCIRQFTLDNTNALHGNGFVTATQGELLDDYPECASAFAVIPEINEEDEKFYRAIHSSDSVIKNFPINRKTKNNQVFLDILANHTKHFMEKVVLSNGESGFRKTIINSSARNDEMNKLAKILNAKECHVIVFNQSGLMVYKCNDSNPIRLKTKGRNFGVLLYYVYKKCDLHTAPLFIIGRRKVDRGLGFHYAPRCHQSIDPKELNFELGLLKTDGIEGLIWTDEFLGHIEVKETATQKAGRLAGIVAQCPQYPKDGLIWWTDQETSVTVIRHCEIVDKANKLTGSRTMIQAIEYAKREVPEKKIKTEVDLDRTKFVWAGKGETADDDDDNLFEMYNTLQELNDRKKELNNKSKNVDMTNYEKDSEGFYICATSNTKKNTIEDMRGFKKLTSNLPKGKDKITKVGQLEMRAYVIYAENETDPENFKFALRWVKRIAE